MARRGAHSTQRLAVPTAANGHPPPSTIAAQIVNNAPNIAGNHAPKDKDEFKQQLGEFLRDPQIDDSEPTLLVDLIQVVTKAGLNPLFEGSIFDLDLPQASDSVEVIDLIVQQKPHLLFESRIVTDKDITKPPVLLWLFPTLLGLLGHPKLGSLQSRLQELLDTCLGAFRPLPSLCQFASIILELYKTCAKSKYHQNG